MPRLHHIWLVGILALVPADGQLDEYQVKAAFVSNFANFVEWPATAFHSPQDPFSICVLGHNPFGHALRSLAEGKSAGGHVLVVHEASDPAQALGCQIVFVSSSERLRFRAVVESLKATNALTVGDTADFINEGGMIALRLEGGRIRMRINADAAKERNLRISAHLLSLAENPK
jgi:hypothetical protein